MSTELYGTLAFAFTAGTATFFAPCVYALLPGYVGYYAAAVDGESVPLLGATSRGVAATVGALCTFAVLSVVALAAGELLESLLPLIERLVGLLLIVLGGVVLWRGTLSLHVQLPKRRASLLGFGLFGALYALAATACVLPLFLAVSVQSFALSTVETLLVLGAYAGSFGLFMLAVTVAIAVGYKALAERVRHHSTRITRAAGVVLVVAGVGQLYFAVAA